MQNADYNMSLSGEDNIYNKQFIHSRIYLYVYNTKYGWKFVREIYVIRSNIDGGQKTEKFKNLFSIRVYYARKAHARILQ